MSLFVVFSFGAVLLGAGGMLSLAWRTAQPRIVLAAALYPALVADGAGIGVSESDNPVV